jgi:hypothetical protein
MIEQNHNFEIETALLHFKSAFDDTVINRYSHEDSNNVGIKGNVQQKIKVNYVFGPKQRILADLEGKTDTVKFPIVAICPTGMGRDDQRVKNKNDNLRFRLTDGSYGNYQIVPWNINVSMSIMAKFQEDVTQIISNFAVMSNPYIIFSWREPKTGREVNAEVFWDGQVAMEYPGSNADLPPNAPFRVMATANFVIKTYLYRTAIENTANICKINTDIVTTKNFYCDYESLVKETADNDRDSYEILGKPQLRYVKDWYFTTGETPNIIVQGDGFALTDAVFVSGSNPEMYTLSSYEYYGNKFKGLMVPEFEIVDAQTISFTLPAPSALGFADIIVVNECGMGQLTVDADRCSRVENPYKTTQIEYYEWQVLQFPYLNGLIISNEMNGGYVIDYNQQMIYYAECYPDDTSTTTIALSTLLNSDTRTVSCQPKITVQTIPSSDSDNQTLEYDEDSFLLTISDGNTISLSSLSSQEIIESDPVFTSWFQSYSSQLITLEDINSLFVHITGDVMVGGLSSPSLSADNLYVGNNTINFIDGAGNIVETLNSNNVGDFKSNFTTVNSRSAYWEKAYTTLSNNSANYNSTYNTVNTNSATNWNYQGTDIKALTANWQSTYTNFSSQSADNLSLYTTVNTNSATNWNYQGTDIKALTANWENTYSTVSSFSALWGRQTLSFNESNAQLTISDGNTVSLSALSGGIGSSGVSYLSALNDVYIPSPVNGQVLTYSSVLQKWTTGSPASASGATGYYGSFYDTTAQTLTGANQAKRLDIANTFEANGVSLSSNKIVFNNFGTYEIIFSIQYKNTSVSQEDIYVWFRKNGVDIPDSSSVFTIPARKSAGIPGHLIAVTPFIATLAANDFIEIYWHCNTTAVTVETFTTHANPTIPDTPGVIITVKQVTNVQLVPTVGAYLPLSGGTVTGVLSSTNVIYASGGDSNQWNNTYSTVQTNSSVNWNYQGTDIKELTGNWENTYTTLNSNSSNWFPSGTGTELQFRLNGNSFGAIANSSVSGRNIILGDAEALSAVSTAYLTLRNTTAATLGLQQVSPSFVWEGQGFATIGSTSQTVRFRGNVLPVQGTANPSVTWKLQSEIDNSGTWNDAVTIASNGNITTSHYNLGTNIAFGPSGSLNTGIAFLGSTGSNTVIYRSGTAILNIDQNGITGTGLQISAPSLPANSTVAVRLNSDAQAILAQRDGTAAQTFRIYNTFTSATNRENATIGWVSNMLNIGTEKGSGGGVARPLSIITDGVERIGISSTGAVNVTSLSGGGVVQSIGGVLSAITQDSAGNTLISTGSAWVSSNRPATIHTQRILGNNIALLQTAVTGTGVATIGGNLGRSITTGISANSAARHAWNNGGINNQGYCFHNVPALDNRSVPFARPIDVSWRIQITAWNASTNGRARFYFGVPQQIGTALAVRGFGFEINASRQVQIVAHDGTTLTTSGVVATIPTSGVFFTLMRVRSDGAGNVSLYIDEVLVGTTTGGPTTSGAQNQCGIHAEVSNGADAAANTIITGDMTISVY